MNTLRNLRQRHRLTQAQLAELAGTSQPTIAAYESASKSPTLRTLERVARALGLEAIVDFIPPLTREDRRSLAVHCAIAERLQDDPAAIVQRARQTLARMSRRHPHASDLFTSWRRILDRPVGEIVDVLVDPRPRARELRHVTPFAGVLTAGERAQAYRQFASSERQRR
jgi:transcriptional regulator with XRE-family HTH domain